jgi:Holliday junction resolvase RusA-like endonuclease
VKPRLAFIVPGHVVPSERVQKIPFVKGRREDGSVALGVRGVTPGESRAYMERVAMCTMAAVGGSRQWADIRDARLPIRIHLHVIRHAWRGDWDNIAKNLCDGVAQSERVFDNDNRITQALVSIETNKQKEERAEVLIETANAVLNEPLWMRCAREAGWRPPLEEEVMGRVREIVDVIPEPTPGAL